MEKDEVDIEEDGKLQLGGCQVSGISNLPKVEGKNNGTGDNLEHYERKNGL